MAVGNGSEGQGEPESQHRCRLERAGEECTISSAEVSGLGPHFIKKGRRERTVAFLHRLSSNGSLLNSLQAEASLVNLRVLGDYVFSGIDLKPLVTTRAPSHSPSLSPDHDVHPSTSQNGGASASSTAGDSPHWACNASVGGSGCAKTIRIFKSRIRLSKRLTDVLMISSNTSPHSVTNKVPEARHLPFVWEGTR